MSFFQISSNCYKKPLKGKCLTIGLSCLLQDFPASAETNSWSWSGAGTSAEETLKSYAGTLLR